MSNVRETFAVCTLNCGDNDMLTLLCPPRRRGINQTAGSLFRGYADDSEPYSRGGGSPVRDNESGLTRSRRLGYSLHRPAASSIPHQSDGCFSPPSLARRREGSVSSSRAASAQGGSACDLHIAPTTHDYGKGGGRLERGEGRGGRGKKGEAR